jgi:hypothetical protein
MHDGLTDLVRAGPSLTDPAELRATLDGSLMWILVDSAITGVFLTIGAAAVLLRRPAGRIFGFVTAAVSLFVTFVALTESPETYTTGNGESAAVRVALNNLLPSWYTAAVSLFTLTEAMVLIAAIVFLASTDSSDYYRTVIESDADGLYAQAIRKAQQRRAGT